MEITPFTHGRIGFIYNSHKPAAEWKLSVGTIQNIEITNKIIKVNFEIDREDAAKSPRWSKKKSSIMLELLDGQDRVIFEHELPFEEKEKISGTIGLREK